MATLYEYYNTGDDSDGTFYGATWRGQTFTPATAHKITSVKLLLYRTGSPGTVTVSIRATDGSGHPTGADLCSGTTDGNTLPTGSPYEWREITLGDGYNLDASTKYAIVVRATSGNYPSNCPTWRRDGSSPTYTGGAAEYSTNSGSTWTTYTNNDYMFEDWGEPIGGITEKSSSDTGSGVDACVSLQTPAAKLSSDTGAGIEAFVARLLAVSDIGDGADVYISLQTGTAKLSSDAGSGVEGIPILGAILTASETGAGVETIIARRLAAIDTGYGAEAGVVGGGGLLKNLLASELGEGSDALTAKIEMPTKGGGMKLWT